MVDLAIKIELECCHRFGRGGMSARRRPIRITRCRRAVRNRTSHHRAGLRAWAGLPLGYGRATLYFRRQRPPRRSDKRIVSIGYLALQSAEAAASGVLWSSWYKHLPWEDHRQVFFAADRKTYPAAAQGVEGPRRRAHCSKPRARRAHRHRPFRPRRGWWNEEWVLQRYELLWESGLVEESPHFRSADKLPLLGQSLAHDHRRILATAIARLRAKIKYRPVVFELMPDSFNAAAIARETVEALAGVKLHQAGISAA